MVNLKSNEGRQMEKNNQKKKGKEMSFMSKLIVNLGGKL